MKFIGGLVLCGVGCILVAAVAYEVGKADARVECAKILFKAAEEVKVNNK